MVKNHSVQMFVVYCIDYSNQGGHLSIPADISQRAVHMAASWVTAAITAALRDNFLVNPMLSVLAYPRFGTSNDDLSHSVYVCDF
jgi:hypothetical protein